MNLVWACDMGPYQKLVMVALADRANEDGVCWPSVQTLAEKTGISVRGVQTTIRSLEDLGLLERQETAGKSNRYLLKLPLHTVHPTIEATPAPCAPLPPQDVHPTPAPGAPNTSMIHQSTNKETDTRLRREADAPPKAGPFQDAINAQSRQGRARLNRPKAWAAWQRISKVHGEQKLLAAYKRYLATDKDAQRDNGDWQAGLQVWLNQKVDLWIDQAPPRSKPVDVDLIRGMLQTRDATPSFAWPEDRLGMTESEARKMIA